MNPLGVTAVTASFVLPIVLLCFTAVACTRPAGSLSRDGARERRLASEHIQRRQSGSYNGYSPEGYSARRNEKPFLSLHFYQDASHRTAEVSEEMGNSFSSGSYFVHPNAGMFSRGPHVGLATGGRSCMSDGTAHPAVLCRSKQSGTLQSYQVRGSHPASFGGYTNERGRARNQSFPDFAPQHAGLRGPVSASGIPVVLNALPGSTTGPLIPVAKKQLSLGSLLRVPLSPGEQGLEQPSGFPMGFPAMTPEVDLTSCSLPHLEYLWGGTPYRSYWIELLRKLRGRYPEEESNLSGSAANTTGSAVTTWPHITSKLQKNGSTKSRLHKAPSGLIEGRKSEDVRVPSDFSAVRHPAAPDRDLGRDNHERATPLSTKCGVESLPDKTGAESLPDKTGAESLPDKTGAETPKHSKVSWSSEPQASKGSETVRACLRGLPPTAAPAPAISPVLHQKKERKEACTAGECQSSSSSSTIKSDPCNRTTRHRRRRLANRCRGGVGRGQSGRGDSTSSCTADLALSSPVPTQKGLTGETTVFSGRHLARRSHAVLPKTANDRQGALAPILSTNPSTQMAPRDGEHKRETSSSTSSGEDAQNKEAPRFKEASGRMMRRVLEHKQLRVALPKQTSPVIFDDRDDWHSASSRSPCSMIDANQSAGNRPSSPTFWPCSTSPSRPPSTDSDDSFFSMDETDADGWYIQ